MNTAQRSQIFDLICY